MKKRTPQKDGIINGGHLVVKKNDLVEATYRLSLQEQRLIALLCSQIKPDDEDFQAYTFKIKDLADLLGVDSHNYYLEMRKTTEKLRMKSLTIYKQEEESVLNLGWLSSSEYFTQKGTVELCFDPKLKPYLLMVKSGFTAYRLEEALSFKSKYSLRLFEIAKRFQSTGKYLFELKEFRDKIGLSATELPKFSNLKIRVIEPAIKEINKKTGLSISIEPQKTGRAVSHLLLTVATKPAAPVKPEPAPELDAPGVEGLINLTPDSIRGLKATRTRLTKALKNHDAAYIKSQIEYTNKKNPKKESYLNYLGKALDENYAELDMELDEEKQKKNARKYEELLQDYRKRSDEALKNLAAKGNEIAQAVIYERAQTTIAWPVEDPAPASEPANVTGQLWTDEQLTEMAAAGNLRAQAELSERIHSQIGRLD